MLAMVALSGTVKEESPGPKNSTNFPTTFFFLSSSVMYRAKSVAVTPSLSSPTSLTPTTSGTVM